jgi:hypothetical protein
MSTFDEALASPPHSRNAHVERRGNGRIPARRIRLD